MFLSDKPLGHTDTNLLQKVLLLAAVIEPACSRDSTHRNAEAQEQHQGGNPVPGHEAALRRLHAGQLSAQLKPVSTCQLGFRESDGQKNHFCANQGSRKTVGECDALSA